jgi:hypothetical protein
MANPHIRDSADRRDYSGNMTVPSGVPNPYGYIALVFCARRE